MNRGARRGLPRNSPVLAGNPPGLLQMFAGASTVVPTGWLLCDGSAVSRSQYSKLFAVIGTQYGTGDGSSTFNLPNLKGRVPVGIDTGQTEFDVLGETGGAKTVALALGEMPSHRHTLEAVDTGVGTGAGINRYELADGAAAQDVFMANAGSGTAHQNLQPYIALHFIIKT